MESRIKGKIALVTGATSGIGKCCAIELAKLGANVIITGRRMERLQSLKSIIEQDFGVKALPLEMDVRNSSDIKNKINSLGEQWKNIDILVNNAGLALNTVKVFENTIQEIDDMIDTNVKGILYMIHAVVPQMVKRQEVGTIINLGSVAGNAAYAGGAIYCSSKAAVRYISDGLRIDLVDTPIRVTTVEPGIVETEFSIVRFDGDTEKAKKVYEGIVPPSAEDIAKNIAYICNLPDHIQVPEIILTSSNQADALHKFQKK
ncbi:SDR family NAD(P)-dependent oxidoreductase [Fusobacterium sp. PH5-44]|uniref:SDR family NAD(P)-dependent oxidoreductase n=1 Tax=unclassified Fusobacterium TaxID=2648384 RepID=UPI003D262B13